MIHYYTHFNVSKWLFAGGMASISFQWDDNRECNRVLHSLLEIIFNLRHDAHFKLLNDL